VREGTLLVRIADNGHGFEPSPREPSISGGVGLWSMSERARALGGELKLKSTPGRGTTIELAV
jgi:signal transduction histidine kinase